jgi:hypothetical protein
MDKTWSTLRKIDGLGRIWSHDWLAPTGDMPMGHDDDECIEREREEITLVSFLTFAKRMPVNSDECGRQLVVDFCLILIDCMLILCRKDE